MSAGVPSPAVRFACGTCGHVHYAWAPRCSSCRAHGLTLAHGVPQEGTAPTRESSVPVTSEPAAAPRPRLVIARSEPEPELEPDELADVLSPTGQVQGPVPITEIAETSLVRDSTGLPPLDHVLGGGLVEASVVLLASPRGVGKSTLSLQMLAGLGHRCLYVTGEETLEQLAGTARRIGALTPRLHVLAERNLGRILAYARALRAQTIVVDSIQKMKCDEVGGRAGSSNQVKECTAQLVDYAKAKATRSTLWLIGHMTGDGDVAGPETMEHEVDVVLELTQGPALEGAERVLRCLGKNRFGPSNLVGRFELTAEGLVPVDADGWDEEL